MQIVFHFFHLNSKFLMVPKVWMATRFDNELFFLIKKFLLITKNLTVTVVLFFLPSLLDKIFSWLHILQKISQVLKFLNYFFHL